MDTRNKILTRERAATLAGELRAQETPLRVVTGHFDILLAEHVRELGRLRAANGSGKLLVVLIPPPEPLLTASARAELVAALRVVDYVVTAEPGHRETLLAALEAKDAAAFESADERRVRQLIEHVHRRQAG